MAGREDRPVRQGRPADDRQSPEPKRQRTDDTAGAASETIEEIYDRLGGNKYTQCDAALPPEDPDEAEYQEFDDDEPVVYNESILDPEIAPTTYVANLPALPNAELQRQLDRFKLELNARQEYMNTIDGLTDQDELGVGPWFFGWNTFIRYYAATIREDQQRRAARQPPPATAAVVLSSDDDDDFIIVSPRTTPRSEAREKKRQAAKAKKPRKVKVEAPVFAATHVDPKDAARFLYENGAVVIPCIPERILVKERQRFLDEIRKWPEYLPQPPGQYPVGAGGFGPHGVPSSFHSEIVREGRRKAHVASAAMWEHFAPLAAEAFEVNPATIHVSQVIDRMVVRRCGTALAGESAHRDNNPLPANMLKMVFGGWVNYNLTDSKLICAPRTHDKGRATPGSFDRLSEAELASYQMKRRLIPIPPGHMLIFFENLKHEVAQNPNRPNLPGYVLRQHTAFFITSYQPEQVPKPMMAKSRAELLNQCNRYESMIIKSGQRSPMYPALWLTNWPDKMQEYTLQYLQPALRRQYTYASGKKAGQTFTFPLARFMPALAEIMPEIPRIPYGPYDIDILVPRQLPIPLPNNT